MFNLDNSILFALTLTFFAGLSTGIGGIIVFFTKKLNKNFLSAALGISAGVMIFISFVELFTEAKTSLIGLYGDKTGFLYTLLAFFGGMALIAIIDNLVPASENPHEVHKLYIKKKGDPSFDKEGLMRIGVISAIAIGIHNFPEGMATFVSAMSSTKAGISIAIAIAIHNIPEGIAIAVPIYYATKSRGKAITYSLLSGLAEPLGAIIGFFLLKNLFNNSFLGIILAAVAGIMIYISLDELLPTAEKYGRHHVAIIGVISGMIIMGFSLFFFN